MIKSKKKEHRRTARYKGFVFKINNIFEERLITFNELE